MNIQISNILSKLPKNKEYSFYLPPLRFLPRWHIATILRVTMPHYKPRRQIVCHPLSQTKKEHELDPPRAQSSTLDELTASYKGLALNYHPDRNDPPDATARF